MHTEGAALGGCSKPWHMRRREEICGAPSESKDFARAACGWARACGRVLNCEAASLAARAGHTARDAAHRRAALASSSRMNALARRRGRANRTRAVACANANCESVSTSSAVRDQA